MSVQAETDEAETIAANMVHAKKQQKLPDLNSPPILKKANEEQKDSQVIQSILASRSQTEHKELHTPYKGS